MELIYEDRFLFVCLKPPQLLSEQTPEGDSVADLLAARNGGYIGVVHRLDRGVGGVMVYARTPEAAAVLSEAIRENRFGKEYLAVVHGRPMPETGEMRDLLFHDPKCNKTFVADRIRNGVKEAILQYSVMGGTEPEELTLVRIRLLTGRTHQIRVQFASRGHALYGDGKYGAHDRSDIALYCSVLTFPHPHTGKMLRFECFPTGEVWNRFDGLQKSE